MRSAEERDLENILEMSKAFYATTHHARNIPLDEGSVIHLVNLLLEGGILLVAEIDEEVVGMIGGYVHPYIFNNNVMQLGEIVWYVKPEHRATRAGLLLLDCLEAAAKQNGVDYMVMMNFVDGPEVVNRAYTASGYNMTEYAWTKLL